MAKSHLKLVTPATANRTVTPKRAPNADLRTREYLTEAVRSFDKNLHSLAMIFPYSGETSRRLGSTALHDRASNFESGGQGFESLPARHFSAIS
jgi:hypothetical protein